MVSHIVELRAKPGSGPALCAAIRDHAVPDVIMGFQGYTSEIVLVALDDPDRVTAISFWDSKASADAFYESGFAKVSTLLAHFMAAKPEPRDCDVFAWVTPGTKPGDSPSTNPTAD
jgi:hypothetical protein